ncbi:MAG: hypothetical protein ACK5VI_01755 [Opitutia bacterium]
MKPPHNLLPIEAIVALIRAADTDVTNADRLARVRAIEETTARLRKESPNHCRQESTT